MKLLLGILLYCFTINSFYCQGNKILLGQFQQQVPEGKIWRLKPGQEVLCELSFLFTTDNRSICAASLNSIPNILYGIAEGDRPNINVTKIYLQDWKKEPYTNDYTYRIKVSVVDVILLPGTKVALTGCVKTLPVFEYSVTDSELQKYKQIKAQQLIEDQKTKNHQQNLSEKNNESSEQNNISTKSSSTSSVDFKKKAEGCHDRNQLDSSIYYYTLEINKSPSLYTYCSRGSIKSEKKDYRGAIEDFNLALAEDSTYGEAYMSRAETYLLMGEYKKTIADCNKIIKLGRRDLQINYLRGKAKYFIADYKGAILDLDKQIKSEGFSGCYYYRGLAKSKLMDSNGACLDLKKAQELGYVDKDNAIKSICK